MPLFWLGLTIVNGHALAAYVGEDLQTGILISVGSLLLVVGTLLRLKFPVTREKPTSLPYTLRVQPWQGNSYVAKAADTAQAQTPAMWFDAAQVSAAAMQHSTHDVVSTA